MSCILCYSARTASNEAGLMYAQRTQRNAFGNSVVAVTTTMAAANFVHTMCLHKVSCAGANAVAWRSALPLFIESFLALPPRLPFIPTTEQPTFTAWPWRCRFFTINLLLWFFPTTYTHTERQRKKTHIHTNEQSSRFKYVHIFLGAK